MHSYHFLPVITKPTRFSPNDACMPTILDQIWLNSLNITKSGIISYDNTDHCPTFLQLPILNQNNPNKNESIKIKFRLNNESTRQVFSRLIRNYDWGSIASDDIHDYVNSFIRTLNELYCKASPLKTKIIAKRKVLNPWYTPNLDGLVKRKSIYFQMFRMGIVTKDENNRFKNTVKSLICRAKRDYYQNLFQQNSNNMRLTWKNINFILGKGNNRDSIKSLLRDNVEFSSDLDIAEIFSDYFANIPILLDSALPTNDFDPSSFINCDPSLLFILDPCTPAEVSNIISDMKITKQDKNHVPIRLFIENRIHLSEVICSMVNKSMSLGTFPDPLKIAKIVPIHKNGDKRLPCNYRPIAMLPYLSKVFEKIIHIRLAGYFSQNSLFSSSQFGFRKNMSTLDAIVKFTEIVYDSINDKQSILNVLIDFSKAFNTVNINILLKKLHKYGIRGKPLDFVRSYLIDRIESVLINKSDSTAKILNIGVPQGSILGPLLFLVYVNEIPSISNRFNAVMFADDCTLIFRNHILNNIISDCNLEMEKFKIWSDANRLTLNLDKTKCLFISTIFRSLPPDSINLQNHTIDSVLDTKFLGLVIDKNLKYDKHIQYISGKISKSIGILYRIRNSFPDLCLKLLYYSIIHPYLLYCLPIFGATYDVHLGPLKILQKRAVRIISGAGYLDHTETLFKSNKILKLQDLYKHSLACYVYKNPEILDQFYRNHNYNTRGRNSFLPPFERLRMTEQSVIHNAVGFWNQIPMSIKLSPSKNSFKFNLKEFLLSQYS